MDKFYKQLWIDALRSGQYEQGKGYLRQSEFKFCCLGVLCGLINPLGWVDVSGDFESADDSLSANDAYLPSDFESALKISVEQEDVLSKMNDQGYTFAEIADYIEAYL